MFNFRAVVRIVKDIFNKQNNYARIFLVIVVNSINFQINTKILQIYYLQRQGH
jgi:hypothetical protein